MIDIAKIYQRKENARWLSGLIADQWNKDNVKTIVVRFARSYFVFVAGNKRLWAYPLSTTRFKWFDDERDIYYFLLEKDIKAVWVFNGDRSHSEIPDLIKRDNLKGWEDPNRGIIYRFE